MPLKTIQVKFALPWIGEIGGEWEPDESEVKAAWELYVELITRVSLGEIKADEGLLREALDSLYSLFGTTREILRKYGPSVGKPKGKGRLSFGFLSVAVLNTVLRPVLSKWHPLLEDYEGAKAAGISPLEHERGWEKAKELRDALNEVQSKLIEYAAILADVAGVPFTRSKQAKQPRRASRLRSLVSRVPGCGNTGGGTIQAALPHLILNASP